MKNFLQGHSIKGEKIMKKRYAAFYRIFMLIVIFIFSEAWASMAAQEELAWCPVEKSRAVKIAKGVTRAKYPDADLVSLYRHKWVRYNKNGTYKEYYEFYSKILTEKGRRSLLTVSSSFTVPYNTTRFIVVEVLKSDGSVLQVDIEKNSRVMIEQRQMESNIYNPNSKILYVSIPKLDLGDTVHCIIFDDFTKARVPDTWSDYVCFESTDPLICSEYTVIAPKARPLQRIALKAEIPGSVTFIKQKHNNSIIYKWKAKDVPRAFPEPKMPPLYSQVQRLLVTTIKDWRHISRWYWNLCMPNIEKSTPEMKMLVSQLIKGIDDPDEKINAIFKWVSQEIRYLGITVEKEAPGYEPHPVYMTFDRRAGVCRDKAALLTAMLRLAGFEAYPVLIMNGPKKDFEVPQPYFNHAITSVKKDDGSYLLMDSTDENTKELLPAYLGNKSYLVAAPEGEILRTSPVQPAEQNMMYIDTKGILTKEGGMNAETVLGFDGINDNLYRGYFARLSRNERHEFFEMIVSRVASGAHLADYRITPANMLDTTIPLKVCITFEVKDFVIPGENVVMLPLLSIGHRIGLVNHIIKEMGLRKRKYTFFTRYACGVKETLNLNLNHLVGRPVSLPEYKDIENRGIRWFRSISFKGKNLETSNVFKMKLPEYSPEEYLTLKEVLKKIETDNEKMPIFSTPFPKKYDGGARWYSAFHADAVVLDELDEFDLKNANNWTETKHMKIKVLTYAGIKKNSDIYIDYNPIWEDIEIRKAQVTSPAGKVRTVEEKEINKMDMDWTGDAPRYPAAKRLVVSFPGVEKGSTIEYLIVRKKKNRPFFSINGDFFYHDMPGKESAQIEDHTYLSINGLFCYYYPIVRKRVRLKVPTHLSLKIFKADNGIGLEKIWKRKYKEIIKEEPGRIVNNKRVYEFSASRVEPVKYESYMPPWYSFNPTVFVSAGDWKQYAEDVKDVLLRAASSQPETEKITGKLVCKMHDGKQKITAIRDFAAKNIRYIDLSISDMPFDQITPADKTLSDGYGNAADRAILLFAMLRYAGYNPEFVLSSWVSPGKNLRRPLHDYPDPKWFDNVLVRVKAGNGYIYLNDTDQYAALGSTLHDGYPGLLLVSGKIEIIKAASPDLRDRMDVTFFLRLFENGDAIIKKTRKFYGMDFARFHKKLKEMPPEKLRRYHQKQVALISQSAIEEGKYINNCNVYPAVEEFSVRAKKYATRQGDYLYLKLPGLINSIGGAEKSKRENPMYRKRSARQYINVEVILPCEVDSVKASPPESIMLPIKRSGQIIMKSGLSSDGHLSISLGQDINLEPVVVTPEEYPQLVIANRILGQLKTRMLLLKLGS